MLGFVPFLLHLHHVLLLSLHLNAFLGFPVPHGVGLPVLLWIATWRIHQTLQQLAVLSVDVGLTLLHFNFVACNWDLPSTKLVIAAIVEEWILQGVLLLLKLGKTYVVLAGTVAYLASLEDLRGQIAY